MNDNTANPPELPEKPEGWTRRMVLHIRCGKGGSAVYDVLDPSGKKTGIEWGYDEVAKTRGFTFGEDPRIFPTWAALREAWPGLLAAFLREQGK